MEILDDFPDHYLLPSTFKISLVLLITFEWIKLEIPDWSHFKDLFNIFKTVTNFMSIPTYGLSNTDIFMGILEDFPIIFFHGLILLYDQS